MTETFWSCRCFINCWTLHVPSGKFAGSQIWNLIDHWIWLKLSQWPHGDDLMNLIVELPCTAPWNCLVSFNSHKIFTLLPIYLLLRISWRLDNRFESRLSWTTFFKISCMNPFVKPVCFWRPNLRCQCCYCLRSGYLSNLPPSLFLIVFPPLPSCILPLF